MDVAIVIVNHLTKFPTLLHQVLSEAVWQNINNILQELILALQFGLYFQQLQAVFRNPLISDGNGLAKKKSARLPIVLAVPPISLRSFPKYAMSSPVW